MRRRRTRGQLWAFVFLVVRRTFELVVLVLRSGVSKEIELLALRQEVVVSVARSSVLRTSPPTGQCSHRSADCSRGRAGDRHSR
jgi:hypothetical protein